MGRHADPDPGAFWRSLGASAARALAVLGIGGLVAFGIVSVTGNEEPATDDDPGVEIAGQPAVSDPAAGSEAAPAPLPPDPGRAVPDESASEQPADPVTAEPDAQATGEPTPAPIAEPVAAAPPPAQTTVQVLDGVGGDGRQARAAAALLRDLGYDVVVVNPAGLDYEATEVQFSSGNDAAARALAARDGRFAAVGPARTLSDSVDLHVIVGSDFSR